MCGVTVENEDLRPLFTDIASYVVTLKGDIDGEHVGKKRKIADRNGNGEVKLEGMPGTFEAMMTANMNSVPNENGGRNRDGKAETGPVALTVKDVSFSMPVRKKLTLEITLGGEGAIGGKGSVIRGVNQGSGEVEFVVGYEDIGEFSCFIKPATRWLTWTSFRAHIPITSPRKGAETNELYHPPQGLLRNNTRPPRDPRTNPLHRSIRPRQNSVQRPNPRALLRPLDARPRAPTTYLRRDHQPRDPSQIRSRHQADRHRIRKYDTRIPSQERGRIPRQSVPGQQGGIPVLPA